MSYDYFSTSCNCSENEVYQCPAVDCIRQPRQRLHPPLPESDDESPTMIRVPTATSMSEDYIPLAPYPDNDSCITVTAELKSPESWNAYRKQIGYLSRFPHITAEAECILDCFLLREYMPTSVQRLLHTIKEIKKAEKSNMFARSLEDSVRWHLDMMEQAGLIEIE
jgi:hypothetical protein